MDDFTRPKPETPQPSTTAEMSPAPMMSTQQPTPPTAPRTSHKKKIFIFVVIILALIAAAAFGGYKFEHQRAIKAEKNQQSRINSLKKQIDASQKPTDNKSTGSSASTASPYAGWKTYTLKYEKLTFKYPSNWQVIDDSNGPNENPHTDNVDFKSPDSFNFNIIDGMKPGGDPRSLDSDSPISVTFAGQPMYLIFSHPSMPKLTNQDPNSVGSMNLLTNPKDEYSWPKDKNVFSTSTVNGGGSNMSIHAWYQTSSGPKYFSSVQQAMNDSEYKNAKLVIESMNY